MPPKKPRAYKKKANKRKGDKIKTRSSSGTLISSSLLQCPIRKRMFTKLRYVSEAITFATTTSKGWRQFALNGLFDPDITGTGHQPLGFDQIKALYDNYRVHSARFSATGQVSTSNVATLIAIGAKEGSSLPTTMTDCYEDGAYKTVIVTNEKPFMITQYIPMHKVAGRSKANYNSENNYTAGIGANPTTVIYGNVLAQCLDESTSQTTIFRFIIDYFVEFFDPAVLSQS